MGKKYTADTFEGAVTGTASGNVAKSGDTMTGALTNTSGDVKTKIGGNDMLAFEADSGSTNNKIRVSRSGSSGPQAYIAFEESTGSYASNKMVFNLATPNSYTENDFLTLQESSATSSDIYIKAHKKIIANDGIYLGTTSATSANHLDDYEEGTFSQTFYITQFGGTTAYDISDFGGATETSKYVKIGRLVMCTVDFSFSSKPNAWVTSGSNQNLAFGTPFSAITGSGHGAWKGDGLSTNLNSNNLKPYSYNNVDLLSTESTRTGFNSNLPPQYPYEWLASNPYGNLGFIMSYSFYTND